ncbi:MAG TPA: SMC family ATPase [Candidatus Saccharimonadales bacterium]|nr:SMC family ATPase [Candidatus Saccharimonadales bacterium]
MKIERIALRGFLSHSATDWQPNGARLAAVVGPNGAGKSSLLDGVLYALYDDARGRTDDLVQLGASEMVATVEFSYAGGRYRVTRGRTTRAGGKSFLELAIAEGDGWRPLTADSIRETQAAIEQLLRMDAATFETAAWLMQGRANAFAEATAAERKRILGTVLGLDVYALAEARARELARDLEAQTGARRDQVVRLELTIAEQETVAADLDGIRTDITVLDDQLSRVRAERDQSQAALVDLIGQLGEADAASREVARLTTLMTEQAATWKAAARRRVEARSRAERAEVVLAQAERIRAASESIPGLEERLAAARAEYEAYQAAHHVWEQDVRQCARLTATEDGARQRLDDLQAQAADTITCPECGATIPAGGTALHERITAAEDALVRARTDNTGEPEPAPAKPTTDAWSISEELATARATAAGEASLVEAAGIRAAALEAIEIETAEAVRIEADGKTTRKALDVARNAAAAGQDLRDQRHSLEAAIEQLNRGEREAEAALADRRQAAGRLGARLEQIAMARAERDTLATEIAGDVVTAGRLRRLVTAFGVNGIPARIVESVLPELGRYANELLAQLRPGMALEIRAQRAKKSGAGIIEALDLVVRDEVGERPLAMFSGGERTSVSLALAVGLSRLVARRAGSRIESLVIDEPEGLDVESRRAFGQSLRILAHAGELSRIVLVSHHDDLSEFADATYVVAKGPGGSVVTEAVA